MDSEPTLSVSNTSFGQSTKAGNIFFSSASLVICASVRLGDVLKNCTGETGRLSCLIGSDAADVSSRASRASSNSWPLTPLSAARNSASPRHERNYFNSNFDILLKISLRVAT
jgi:hypothetical protein